jgi:tripartite-type tricarboxylate transporter receptor subunit TctC
MRWVSRLFGFACMLAATGPAAAEDFYQGKSINLIVGNNVGGGYDQYARLLARHMGKHIPGQPNFVVKNQPGASGMLMANAMYATVARDGLSIGLMARDNPIQPVLGNPAARFKPENFTWLGTSSRYEDDAFCLMIRSDAGVNNIEGLQTSERPAIFGGSAEGGSETDVVLIARDVFRLNLQLVRGYRTSPALTLAMERGEIEGRAITYSTVQKVMGDWLKEGKLRCLLQFGREARLAGLPNVPTARELVTTPDDKALIELVDIPFEMARPFIAPPGIPADRAAILKQAFMATQKDPEYLQEAKSMQLDISPLSGDEIAKIMTRIAYTAPGVIARYHAALNSK